MYDHTWGWHLLIDAAECDNCINNQHVVRQFLQDLVVKLDMHPIGKPMVVYVDTEEGEGVSGIQLITTSTLTFHGDAHNNQIFIDIFSCKPYNPDIVVDFVLKLFQPKRLKYGFTIRDASKDSFTFESTGLLT